ncbi:glycosyltransferase [Oscillospiraceae bacterium N12]|jgi:glycosyltransferase involved in cell wall biosynthesis|uniref:Glycosyltransferase n=1 Tax=Jilunia laotingensis TaxID=2763675 RepID=A0A926F1S6_9BACT|nr:glycosyltransferase [Jilunia laotingensis]MBC8594093.1 glycosyltransferase [Jilunia laotingensis]
MKILHIIPSLEIGGAERLLSDLLPLLKEQNNSVDLLLFSNDVSFFYNKLKFAGIKIYSLNRRNFYNPLIVINIMQRVRGYDIVHVHLFPSLYWVSIASLFSQSFFFYTEHSTFNKRRNFLFLQYLERIVYKPYHRIISISDETQIALKKWLGIVKEDNRFKVISNGIDLNSIISDKEKFTHEELGIPEDSKILIMVSRFTLAKDQKTLIKSMKYVLKSVHLLLVGDGDTQESCRELASNLGLSNIHFLGKRDDIVKLMNSSDIGIQSSNWEGFGLTALEMMASGLPVIASDVAGLKQVVEGAGLVFEVNNAFDLAQKINDLLNNIPLYNKIKSQSLQRALEYDIRITAQKYLCEYKSIHNV